MKTESRSERIDLCSFIFCVLVLLLHSFNAEMFTGGSEKMLASVVKIESFLSDTLGQLAVPGFFMISAFLFYRNFDFSKLIPKWKSRVKSVLLPYLLWNLIYYLLYLGISQVPALSAMVGREVVFSGKELLLAVGQYVYNPVYWYLFQLILLIVLAPVIYLLEKNCVIGILGIAGGLALIKAGGDLPLLNADALVYYLLGAWAGLHLPMKEEPKKWIAAVTTVIFVGLACFSRLYFLRAPGPFPTVLYRMTGAAAVVAFVSALPKVRTFSFMRNTFLVYTLQLPVIRIVNKLGVKMISDSALAGLILYFLLPVIVICFTESFSFILEKTLPKVKKILSGGR